MHTANKHGKLEKLIIEMKKNVIDNSIQGGVCEEDFTKTKL